LAQEPAKLAAKQYVDPKGFFKVIPPANWKVQEYPNDPRGKVAFLAPGGDADFRVLINAVDSSTINALIKFCRDLEKRIGINTNIKKIEFFGRPAVQRSFQLQGKEVLAIDFLVGQTDHNLQFVGSPDKFNIYRDLIMKSLETYEPISRKVSDQEATKHLVAKKVRLAQWMIENHNYSQAMAFVKEGLQIAPNEAELLKLQKELETKK